MEVKAGYQSTEFYITIISQVIAVAALAGWIVPSQTAELLKSITAIIGGIIAIIPAIVYIYNRTWLKSKALPLKK